MGINLDSPLEAFSHCCSEIDIREYLNFLPESRRESLRTQGHLALSRALEFNKKSFAVVRALLERPEIQVNLPHVGADGNTALHLAVLLQDEEAVRLLLARQDLDPNVGNRRFGEAPLHVAVKTGVCQILELLLSDARVNAAALTNDNSTVLHVVCKNARRSGSSVEIVRKLLASVTTCAKSLPQFLQTTDDVGRTALHYAAESGSYEVAGEILKALPDSDVDHLALAKDSNALLAVQLAAQKGHREVLDRLLQLHEYSKDEDSSRVLHDLLSRTTHLHIANFLLEKLYEALLVNKSLEALLVRERIPGALLQWAVMNPSSEDFNPSIFVPHILKWHPEIANKYLDSSQTQTALHIATILGNEPAVRALCSESAPWVLDANRRDAAGITPLNYAFETENEAIQNIIEERRDVKRYLQKLQTKRQTYAFALQTILVVAVLIATVTYSSCKGSPKPLIIGLAPGPSPASSSKSETTTLPTTRLAFFLSMTAMVLAAFAGLPFSFRFFSVRSADDRYVQRSLFQTRVLIVLASHCLLLSILSVMFSFLCSEYISPFVGEDCALACKITLVVFLCLVVALLAARAVMSRLCTSRTSSGTWRRIKDETL